MESYCIDQANTSGQKYDGSDLFNLRASYFAAKVWEIYDRLMNIAKRCFAKAKAYTANGREYAPGMPRTAYIGPVYRW
jgi:outer membrane cobalamin receptor